LLLDRTIRDNVVLAVLSRLSRGRVVLAGRERDVARAYADRLRVRAPSVETPVSALSGGNQQKVVLARWLARQPRVLILDEPTRGVDVGAKSEIYRIVSELAAEGVAVLVISSDMPELLGLSDRIVVLRQGRISGRLDRSAATEAAVLALSLTHQEQELHR
jgi:L-arabinose transport system ATP-binding protein